jgi:hypothetical protein
MTSISDNNSIIIIITMTRNSIVEVFSTPELIALILAHLPPRELLLTAPLISPNLYLTTLNTPFIQEILFFQPYHSLSEPPKINPFLSAAFPTHFHSHSCYQCSPDIRNLPWARHPDAFARKEASWRKMLLWNGGEENVRRVRVVSEVQRMSGTYRETGYLEAVDWVRMGAVWDLTRSACEMEEKGRFCLNWREDVEIERGNEMVLHGPIGAVRQSRALHWVVFGKVKSWFRDEERHMREEVRRASNRRLEFETRYQYVGGRIPEDGGEVLEIKLSTWMDCEGRSIFDPPPKGLGDQFLSEGREKVLVNYEEAILVPDITNGAGRFWAQARS